MLPHAASAEPTTAEPTTAEQTSAALLREVQESLQALAELEPHGEQLGEPTIQRMRDTVAEIRQRLAREEVFVCVVGEQKAGKSTFLNAILGMPLLGTAVRECTGTVTYIRPASRPGYRARLQSGQWEDFAEKFPDQQEAFTAKLHELDQKLQHCDHVEATYPSKRDQLTQRLQHLQRTLQTQSQDLERTDRNAREQEAWLAQITDETRTLGSKLKETEKDVPWRYRRATGWQAAGHRMGRFLIRRTSEPHWEAYLADTARWEQQQTEIARLAADLQTARQLAQESRLAVDHTQQEIETTKQQLAEVCQTLDALPALRAHSQQARAEQGRALREYSEQRFEQFREAVKPLTDMNHRGSEVQELHLFVPTQRLPAGMVLIDTPGVNTTTEENQQRAWKAIQDHADACLLISDLTQTVSESTREFVRRIRRVTPHLLLVLTKRDVVLRNAMLSGGDAEEELAEAIQVGRSRFAAEVGRAEEEVLTFAVAAQPALQESLSPPHTGPASAAFNEELSRIYAVVGAERSIAITAKSASLLRNVHHDSAAKISAADQAYQQRIETLMQQRVDNPVALVNQRITDLVPQIRQTGEEISKLVREQLRDKLTALREVTVQQVEAATDLMQLSKAVKEFQESVPTKLQHISIECRQQVDAQFADSLADLVNAVRDPLRQRYQISQSIAATGPQQKMSVQVLTPLASLSLSNQTQAVLKKIKVHISGHQSLGIGIGRLASQAITPRGASGTALLIGAGIAATQAAMLARKFPGLRESTIAKVAEMLDELIAQATSEATLGATATEQQLGRQLTQIVWQDLQHFQQWIEAVIQREQQLLAGEQQKLAHLRFQIEKLQQQDARLLALLEQATTVCHGLSQQQ